MALDRAVAERMGRRVMKYSVIMTTYNRPTFLYHCLKSIQRQHIENTDHEILVLDDGTDEQTPAIAKSDATRGLTVRYLHTGVRTMNKWRTMGMTANIGIQQATGDIIVLTSSDIYHLGQTVVPVVKAVERDAMALSSVHAVHEDDGRLIGYLDRAPQSTAVMDPELVRLIEELKRIPPPPGVYPTNPDVPFFLAVRREHLMRLGGYDEDFIGIASEDCDLLDRLKAIGCHYTYAPKGSEVAHLFHGRRNIKGLEADPGFAYNIALRRSRVNVLERNKDRRWGELIDPSVPQATAPIHLVLWVTSKCNLDCPLCNQRFARHAWPNYDMPLEELDTIVRSCRERGIRFSTIELSGGEPTLWPLFEEGIARLQDSGITDAVTFITNGREAEHTAKIANRFGLYYVVSKSQATPEQIDIHRKTGVGVVWNEAGHRAMPTQIVPDTLPAACTQRQDMHGRVIRQMLYLHGTIWRCCMAHTNSHLLATDDELSCAFTEDFPTKFQETAGDICQVCLCNAKVWKAIGEGRTAVS